MADPRPVFAYAPDLMDRSRIAAAFAQARFVASPAELAAAPTEALVLIDLARPAALDALPAIRGETIGFASHVDDTLLAAARAAGCGTVLPRSRFFRRLSGDLPEAQPPDA